MENEKVETFKDYCANCECEKCKQTKAGLNPKYYAQRRYGEQHKAEVRRAAVLRRYQKKYADKPDVIQKLIEVYDLKKSALQGIIE